MARPTVDLPHPDSPTSPNVSPRRMASVTPSTARTSPTCRSSTSPLLMGNQTLRSSTSTSGGASGLKPPPRGGELSPLGLLVGDGSSDPRPPAGPLVRGDRVEARHAVPRLDLLEPRHLVAGARHLVRAPGLEGA